MQISRNANETVTGPSDWFTGAVFIDPIAAPAEPSRLQAAAFTSPPAPEPRGTRIPSARTST